MKNMKTRSFFDPLKISAVLVVIILIAGCSRDNNYTGHAYFPDMAYSHAFETYGSSPNYDDSVRMLLPVEGTVPRGAVIPYRFKRTFQDQQSAGQELVNPYAASASKEDLQRGKEQYEIFCAMCHGEQGKGDGHLYTKKLFTAQPTSLVGDYVQNKPDGEIYHVITLGSLSGLMGAQGPMIKPDDRWKIVAYVKNGFTVK